MLLLREKFISSYLLRCSLLLQFFYLSIYPLLFEFAFVAGFLKYTVPLELKFLLFYRVLIVDGLLVNEQAFVVDSLVRNFRCKLCPQSQ